MISVLLSRIVILVCGTLYPAYASYKAVRTKNVKEYVKWMMYWIVFALFSCVETFADIFLAFWLPLYYEMKILFIFWLLSPTSKGASLLYRKFVHPILVKHEQEIDSYVGTLTEKGYTALLALASRGFTFASNALLTTALEGKTKLTDEIRKSYSVSGGLVTSADDVTDSSMGSGSEEAAGQGFEVVDSKEVYSRAASKQVSASSSSSVVEVVESKRATRQRKSTQPSKEELQTVTNSKSYRTRSAVNKT